MLFIFCWKINCHILLDTTIHWLSPVGLWSLLEKCYCISGKLTATRILYESLWKQYWPVIIPNMWMTSWKPSRSQRTFTVTWNCLIVQVIFLKNVWIKILIHPYRVIGQMQLILVLFFQLEAWCTVHVTSFISLEKRVNCAKHGYANTCSGKSDFSRTGWQVQNTGCKFEHHFLNQDFLNNSSRW